MTVSQEHKIDLYDPDVYVAGVPHDQFDYLRREAPIYWHPEPNGKGYWAITRYDDVVEISRQPEIFSSHVETCMLYDYDGEAKQRQQMMMVNQDPPDHTRLRSLVNRGFTPRMTARLEAHIREVCQKIVDEVAVRGECEFVHDVAARLPIAIIAELLGAPPEDHDKIEDWSNKLIGFDDPEFQNSPEQAEAYAFEMWAYANQLGNEKRKCPADDIVSKLIAPDADGNELSELEFDMFFILLTIAGNETTRNATSGGMLAFLDNTDQWQRLLNDRSLLPTAVDEVLRWVTPVMQFRRTAMKDAVIGGQEIKAGDKVVMYYGSANRDEAVFDNPHTFDIGRSPNPMIAFGGGGPHYCLGTHLAKLELRIMLETLLDRMPDIELAGPVRRLRSNFINGVKEMPVRFTPSVAGSVAEAGA